MASSVPPFSDGMDEICQEFLVESYENLDELDRALVALEQEPDSRDLLASVFRTIHTIKGTSGFLAFNRLEAVTHVGENVLSRLRDGHLRLTPEITTCLLRMVDTVRALLATIEENGVEGDIDTSEIEALLAACLEPKPEPATAEAVEADVAADPAESIEADVADEAEPVDECDATDEVAVADVDPAAVTSEAGDDAPAEATRDEEPLVAAATPEQLPESPAETRTDRAPVETPTGGSPVDTKETDVVTDENGPVPADPGSTASEDTSSAVAAEESDEQHGRKSVADSSIRVDVGLLDQLMRLVGELVLTRNQVVQYVGDLQHAELQRASQRLNLIATELQEGVMKTRMQPIDQVWSRLPRVVRDLGSQCGKSVRLVMEGRETELDRTLLEAVKDPLTHLVRNAIDHGLETPAARVEAGKPAEGTLTLRAYHEGGQVVVEVTDDGAGIDPERVKAKALERGIITRESLTRMSQREVLDLIFRPGFSTAAAVTNVSGRGVGMDVVRTNIEKIGGTVDVVSEHGHGTTVRVRIPLTLAIIPALVVGQGGDVYAIPQANLLELVRLDGESADSGIEHVAGAPVYRLRGTLLPLVFLADQLGLPPTERAEAINIVVLAADNTHFGLVVEEISDTQEIVVRPLSRQIKHVDAFAGATITGDGKVALILDVGGLAQRATALPASATTTHLAGDGDVHAAQAREAVRLLICQVGDDRRLALPMADVARLEEIPVGMVERAGAADVVQYRGDLLRLIQVGDLLGVEPSASRSSESYTVVVHRHEDESAVGLVVDQILDVVEEDVQISDVGRRVGLHGSAVLQSRVTDVVDVPALVAAASGGNRG